MAAQYKDLIQSALMTLAVCDRLSKMDESFPVLTNGQMILNTLTHHVKELDEFIKRNGAAETDPSGRMPETTPIHPKPSPECG